MQLESDVTRLTPLATALPDPAPLYGAAALRELDHHAITRAGIPGYTLMTRAAQAAWEVLQARWPHAQRLQVLCGTGNNGGDGLVLARLARAAGRQVEVLQLGEDERLRGEALQAHADWLAAGGTVQSFSAERLGNADVLVDALLGTGFSRSLDADWATAIHAINATRLPVLALDIPSGLDCDTGRVRDVAVRAALTVTFIAGKTGLFTGQGPAFTGPVLLADLAVPAVDHAQVAAAAWLYRAAPLGALAQPRSRSAHKGDFGHVLIVGGDLGMAGAARLAGEAALRVGAGRVTVATRQVHAALLSAACPELMCHGTETVAELQTLLARCTVLVVGPGLGRSAWSRALLAALLETPHPAVLDADALNLLAADPRHQTRWILTPHPGEAARLLHTDTAGIAADRCLAVREIATRFGGIAVLKGAGTLISAATGLPGVCAAGNPGMASAGMGDVLAGTIGGLLAQGLSLQAAALAGVCVHAGAADRAAASGERGMLARDVIAGLREQVNPMS